MSQPYYLPGVPLCVVLFTYVAPVEKLDALMADHVAWLNEGYEQGLVLVSGRRDPRIGGVMLVRGTKDEAHAYTATAPFVTHGLVEFEVVDFVSGMAAPALIQLLG